jgi:hypothetical protein
MANQAYYFIDESIDTKIIGPHYPQIELIDVKIEDGLDEIAHSKGRRMKKVSKVFNIKLPARGKLTDAISCSLGAGFDLMVSNKLYKILKTFSCTSIQFFPVTFQHKNETISNYRWIHFTYELEHHIDFSASTYDPAILKKINSNKPATYKDYLSIIKTDAGKYNWLRLSKTVLKKTFPKEEDFFMLCAANQKRYISEGLYEELIKNKITGLDFHKGKDLQFQ